MNGEELTLLENLQAEVFLGVNAFVTFHLPQTALKSLVWKILKARYAPVALIGGNVFASIRGAME